jgi:hypothetical protein
MITIERLTKKYGPTVAVDDVSFTAAARPGDRLPRPQQGRQVDHHADHGRLTRATYSRESTRTSARTPCSREGSPPSDGRSSE